MVLCALFGCKAPAAPPTVGDLHFPVLVLFEQGGVLRHNDAADLNSMSVQRVVGSNSPPFLIDSNLDIYRLDRLASVHGGIWLIANPSGRTEVTFDLARVAQSDAAQSRRLIAERDQRARSDDDGGAREHLARAQTFDAMAAAIGR